MLNNQSEIPYHKGDITFLLDIVGVILPVTRSAWREVADVYNSGVSSEQLRTSIELRSHFCEVRILP
jgi:hypothetical protein